METYFSSRVHKLAPNKQGSTESLAALAGALVERTSDPKGQSGSIPRDVFREEFLMSSRYAAGGEGDLAHQEAK
jgi:hypothetical protein